MGSELIRRGEMLPLHIWSAHINLHNPEKVFQIHLDNIQAGSHMITANTFRTTPRAYNKTGLSKKNAVDAAYSSLISAVQVARKAAKENIVVLGSIAPLEDCYMPEIFPGEDIAVSEFSQLGNWLKDSGVDGIIIETMNSILEARSALKALSHLKLPLYISFYLKSAKQLGSGEHLKTALSFLKNYSIEGVLINCSQINVMSASVDIMMANWCGLWGIYPNLGLGNISPNGSIKETVSDKRFLFLMRTAVNKGAKIIGGCCGSTPHHIKLIKNEFSNV
jgi:homocysteine S-methyltransferase